MWINSSCSKEGPLAGCGDKVMNHERLEGVLKIIIYDRNPHNLIDVSNQHNHTRM
jgi:hypothetical protein